MTGYNIMPSTYTAPVQDGTITTLRDFAMLCARAFGATITMRDDPLSTPIPERFEPSSYYAEQLDEARSRLASLKALSPMQAQRECQQQYSAAMARWRESTWEAARRRVRYIKMINHVEAWRPPTPDHDGLKGFMLRQIGESLDWDCGERLNMPLLQRWPDWLRDQIAEAEREIIDYARNASKENERANSRTQWVQALRASLPK